MFFKSKNISMYYEKYGASEKTILILPGWGDTRTTFMNLINYFSPSYTIYIVDYPGFGNSPVPKESLTIYDYAKLIKDFIKYRKIKNPIIIAHSFGGRITAILSGLYKIPIEKMILIDIAGIKQKKSIKTLIKEKLYKFLKRIVSFSKRKEKYQKKLLNLFASSDYKALPNTMHETFKNIINEDLTNHFNNIPCEALLIWGNNDDITPIKYGRKLNKLIRESALIVYPRAKHFPYLDYPYLTNKIIYEFLKEE